MCTILDMTIVVHCRLLLCNMSSPVCRILTSHAGGDIACICDMHESVTGPERVCDRKREGGTGGVLCVSRCDVLGNRVDTGGKNGSCT